MEGHKKITTIIFGISILFSALSTLFFTYLWIPIHDKQIRSSKFESRDKRESS